MLRLNSQGLENYMQNCSNVNFLKKQSISRQGGKYPIESPAPPPRYSQYLLPVIDFSCPGQQAHLKESRKKKQKQKQKQ